MYLVGQEFLHLRKPQHHPRALEHQDLLVALEVQGGLVVQPRRVDLQDPQVPLDHGCPWGLLIRLGAFHSFLAPQPDRVNQSHLEDRVVQHHQDDQVDHRVP